MEKAIAVGGWAAESAKVAFQTMEVSPDLRAAAAILDVLRVGRVSFPLTRRAVHQVLKDRKDFKRAESLQGGFALLESHGWLRFPNERQLELHPSLGNCGGEGIEGLRGEGVAS